MSARDLSIAFRRDRADDAALSKKGAAREPSRHKILMTREELFAALAKKGIPPFATSTLGFVLGSLMDHAVTEQELRALCGFLIDQIAEVKKNPEALACLSDFSAIVEKQMSLH